MPSGGGGKVSVDTKPQQDAIAFAKEVFFDYALPFTEQQRGVGQNALSALAYETGLGAAPTIYADQQPTAPSGGGANAQSSSTAALNSSDARLREYAQRLGFDPYVDGFDYASVSKKRGGAFSADREVAYNGQYMDPGQFHDQYYAPELQRYTDAQAAAAAAANAPVAPVVDPNAPPPENLYRGFQQTPGYQFALDQGQRGLANAMNAAGVGRDSGALRVALSDHAMGMANQEYGSYISRLAGLAGMGQEGTAMALNAGTGAASQVGQSANAIVAANLDAAKQNAANRGSAFGAFGQLLGTGLGAVLGGPAGAAAGAGLFGGSAFGSGLGTGISSGFTPILVG